jgi:hypothetical protein
MALKKPTRKKTTAKSPAPQKLTHAELSRASVEHFPKVKAAAEKALRDAGITNLTVHSVLFRADADTGSDPCQGKCADNETCMLSSTGEFVCVPNH